MSINHDDLARECLAEAHGNPERAIALARKRLGEIYLAQIKRESDYFAGIKRANAARFISNTE